MNLKLVPKLTIHAVSKGYLVKENWIDLGSSFEREENYAYTDHDEVIEHVRKWLKTAGNGSDKVFIPAGTKIFPENLK